MKKICFLLIFVVSLYSCSGSGSSGTDNNSKTERSIKGIVEISGNAFVDFDLKNSGQSINDTYTVSQYVIPDSTISGYVDYSSDKQDWFVFYAENAVKVSIESQQGINAFIGTNPLNLQMFETYNLAGSSQYYIQVLSGGGSGSYLIKIEETGKSVLSADLDFVPGEVLVKFKGDSKTAQGLSAGLPDNLELKKDHEFFQVYRISSKKAQASSSRVSLKEETVNLIKELEKNPLVEYAEPNFIRKPNYIPNDYYYDILWNLDQISAPEAWNISRGDGVVAAVLDTGVTAHEELPASRLVKGYDFVDMDEDTSDAGVEISGLDYHGTHIAGIIGASMDNYRGIAGVSPRAFIMPVRIIKESVSSENIANGIRFAAGLSNPSGKIPSKKADIINMSLGGEGYSQTEKNACDAAAAQGVILLSSAGNEGTDIVYYPAGYSSVISVSAVDKNKQIASYSNFGNFITLAAPGGDGSSFYDFIVSLGGPEPNSYNAMAGTSMATPHVSGVVALMKSINSSLDSQDIFNMISSGKMTEDLGDPGYDSYFGYGLIDAEKSVYALNDFTSYSSVKAVFKNSSDNIIDSFNAEKTSARTFSYTFKVSAPGTYTIEAGIDLNNDGRFEGIGEISKSVSIVYSDNDVQAEKVVLAF